MRGSSIYFRRRIVLEIFQGTLTGRQQDPRRVSEYVETERGQSEEPRTET